jgi:hypothetical protein
MRLGVTGGPSAPFDPVAVLGRALAAGLSLSPGDVLVAAPASVRGGPDVPPSGTRGSGRGAVRRLLAESVLRGAASPAYLRPGTPVRAEADLLGALEYRLVVPPGVQLPESRDVVPGRGEGGQGP